jgi:hypothetical protein
VECVALTHTGLEDRFRANGRLITSQFGSKPFKFLDAFVVTQLSKVGPNPPLLFQSLSGTHGASPLLKYVVPKSMKTLAEDVKPGSTGSVKNRRWPQVRGCDLCFLIELVEQLRQSVAEVM